MPHYAPRPKFPASAPRGHTPSAWPKARGLRRARISRWRPDVHGPGQARHGQPGHAVFGHDLAGTGHESSASLTIGGQLTAPAIVVQLGARGGADGHRAALRRAVRGRRPAHGAGLRGGAAQGLRPRCDGDDRGRPAPPGNHGGQPYRYARTPGMVLGRSATGRSPVAGFPRSRTRRRRGGPAISPVMWNSGATPSTTSSGPRRHHWR